MLSRVRKIQRTLAGHLPYSRARGRRAHSRGNKDLWINKAKRVSSLLDGMAIFLLFGAAFLLLAAMGLSNGWLAAGGGLVLALSLFTMAGTIWIDKQVSAVEEHAYYSRNPRPKDPGDAW